MVVSSPHGVRVSWRPGHTPLRPAAEHGSVDADDVPIGGFGQGIKAAMAMAVASVLEQAGYCVGVQETELLVTGSLDGKLSSPVPIREHNDLSRHA
jgi:hypothetical protein